MHFGPIVFEMPERLDNALEEKQGRNQASEIQMGWGYRCGNSKVVKVSGYKVKPRVVCAE